MADGNELKKFMAVATSEEAPTADLVGALADSCPAPELEAFIKEHPGHTVISYVNTSADVKALTE